VAAARAGGDVTFVARVGDDMFGHEAIAGFKEDKINVDYVRIDPDQPSGVALIYVDELGENSIGVASGANANLSLEDVNQSEEIIGSADILLMQLETPLATVMRAAEIAAEAGVRVILNPAPAFSLDDSLLSMLSVITPNESEAELLTGIPVNDYPSAKEAAERLLERGVRTAIITLGKQGALLRAKDLAETIPGFEVTAVDTTAAGDVFNGALAVAIGEGKPLEEAVRFANAAAAVSVTQLGAQPSAPSRTAIEELFSR